MNPVWTEDCNVVYKGPRPDIGDLRCHRVAPGIIRVTYEPTEDEREILIGGGYVELILMKEPIPPVSVGVVARGDVVVKGEHNWKVDVEPGDKLEEEKEDGEADSEESSESSASSTDGSAPQGEETDSGLARAHVDDAPTRST